jgi:hypothetical protein
MGVEITTPFGDLTMQFGETVLDGHGGPLGWMSFATKPVAETG